METRKLYPVISEGITYWVDKEAEIKPLDWVIDAETNKIFQYYTKRGVISHTYQKVEATTYPYKQEGLYQVQLPDEIWERAWGIAKQTNIKDEQELLYIATAWYDGYYANKAKFSEIDIRKAYNKGKNDGVYHEMLVRDEDWDAVDDYIKNNDKQLNKFIQSLNKPKEVESVLVAMVSDEADEWQISDKSMAMMNNQSLYKTNKEGLLDIIKVNWKL